MSKRRLDQLLHEQYPQYSRQQIQSWIMQRKASVGGVIVDKPGTQIKPDADVRLSVQEPKFVGRAGFKLEKALDHFGVDVTGLIALDAGLSTGGFTDCLLQRGIKEVFGIDVGYGQAHEKIRADKRVHVMERTNLRTVTPALLGTQVDIVTLDVSFISLLKVMDAVDTVLKDHGILITLIKPQFEAEKSQIGRGGIVKDPAVHEHIITTVPKAIAAHGYVCMGVIESPITGADGNKEFLALFKKDGAKQA
jgi:23S rRNA (cytidine1920-2'-O)/16S rRNA (cytidine1409-2'-O)-methyltransferase